MALGAVGADWAPAGCRDQVQNPCSRCLQVRGGYGKARHQQQEMGCLKPWTFHTNIGLAGTAQAFSLRPGMASEVIIPCRAKQMSLIKQYTLLSFREDMPWQSAKCVSATSENACKHAGHPVMSLV